ncbi:unnamed protein product [Closterium sp. NIES-65]|nr:unnamed protein product [Closterium sp. NIES-65]
MEWWRHAVRWLPRPTSRPDYNHNYRNSSHDDDIHATVKSGRASISPHIIHHLSPREIIAQKANPLFPDQGFAPSLRQWHVSTAAGCGVTLVLLISYLLLQGGPVFSLGLAFRVGPPRDCDLLRELFPVAVPCHAAPSPPQPCAHRDPLCCAPPDPSPPEPANLTLWREQLRGVVLAILYNRAPLVNSSVALLRSVYGRVFRDVVVYSDEAIPELGVLPLRGEHTPWYFAHATLADVFERYPSAAGVLWSNDDVILNYWTLAGANTSQPLSLSPHLPPAPSPPPRLFRFPSQSRIWFPNNPTLAYRWVSLSPSGPFTPNVSDWTNNPPIREKVRAAVDSLSPPLRARFEAATAEHKGMYTKRIADVVYVPMRHAPLISTQLLPAFSRVYSEAEQGVTSHSHRPLSHPSHPFPSSSPGGCGKHAALRGALFRVAVGNMLLCVEPFSEWDPVLDATVYLWDAQRDDANASYSTRIPALHPWKLSTRDSQQLLLRRMRDADPSLDEVYREFFCNNTGA